MRRASVTMIGLSVALGLGAVGCGTDATGDGMAPMSAFGDTYWVEAHAVRLHGDFPQNVAPVTTDVIMVVKTAPMDPAHPQNKGDQPAPIQIPVHDSVIAHEIRYVERATCIAFLAKATPAATDRDVHTRVDPNGSGHVLAYEVNLGDGWKPLNSMRTVNAAINANKLMLEYFSPGGTCWTGEALTTW